MVRILHLSDLHVGQTDQSWLWPNMEKKLIADLESVSKRAGDWDLVVFSGDFTQKGSAAEYAELTCILRKLWDYFNQKNSILLYLLFLVIMI